MNRLVSIVGAIPSAHGLLQLLEGKLITDEEWTSELIEAIVAVFEEKDQNLVVKKPEVDSEEKIVEFKCIPMREPLGEFDISFQKESFTFYSRESTDVAFQIPYHAVLNVVSIWMKGHEVCKKAGLNTENEELANAVQNESHIFIHLNKGYGVKHHGRYLNTLAMVVDGEITVISPERELKDGPSTGNPIDKMQEVLTSVGMSKERFDTNVIDADSSKHCTFASIYHGHAGYLFLMETSVCFSGHRCCYIPHEEIAAVAMDSMRDIYFTLCLYTTMIKEKYQFEHLSNTEKETILHYCKSKNLTFISSENFDYLYPSSQQQQDTKDGEETPKSNKNTYQVLLKRRTRGENCKSRTSEEPAEYGWLPEEEDFLSSEENVDQESQEDSADGPIVEEPSWQAILNVKDDEDQHQDSQDEDYNPEETEIKRKREASEQGCFVKRACVSDVDDDLVEIDSSLTD